MEFSDIKGFGEKRIKLMKDAGFEKPDKLLTYFPTRYVDTAHLSDLTKAEEGDRVVILACTTEKPTVLYPRRGLIMVKAKFTYGGKTVWVSWFNQRFMAKNIVPGRYYYLAGRLKKFRSSYEISAPQVFRFTGLEPPVIPVYKAIGRVGSSLISDAVKAAIKRVSVSGYVPNDLAESVGLMDTNTAFSCIHAPTSMADVYAAQRSLGIEKLAYSMCAYSLIKDSVGNARVHYYIDNIARLREKAKDLPFLLTAAQGKAISEIIGIMQSDKRLNALVEGDVGCGKTVVAFFAAYYVILSGKTAAIMAPTEILAFQHYQKATEFFAPLGFKCAYLSGSMPRKERDAMATAIENGEYDCIIGTHALISDSINIPELSLVVIDEQHRFGVAQRARLQNKASGVDCIVMSATPIPRTIALTLYGDLTNIVIDEMPKKKASTVTRVVPKSKEKSMWEYINQRAQMGEQAFVVAPKIGDDEEDDSVSAESLYNAHKDEFGDSIAILHGKQKESVKAAVMSDFVAGKTRVLVATTVVEVGIDVPNATTMVIYGADRFGLSQLHQLRGRVGRGRLDSYCFVLTDSKSPEALSRLEHFVSTTSGFELAEYDFGTRGAGDFLGYSQHGNSGHFPSDVEEIKLCKRISVEMLSRTDCRKKVQLSLAESAGEYFSEITLN